MQNNCLNWFNCCFISNYHKIHISYRIQSFKFSKLKWLWIWVKFHFSFKLLSLRKNINTNVQNPMILSSIELQQLVKYCHKERYGVDRYMSFIIIIKNKNKRMDYQWICLFCWRLTNLLLLTKWNYIHDYQIISKWARKEECFKMAEELLNQRLLLDEVAPILHKT